MSNTYTSLFVHFIFSTLNREPLLVSGIRERVWTYLGGIARKNRFSAISVGGTMDHSHMLVLLPPALSVAHAVQLVKGGSSKWIHETFRPLRNFAWQEGYGAFTVEASSIGAVKAYIENQEEHHRVRSFQEEYLSYLKEYGVEYDDRYIWG